MAEFLDTLLEKERLQNYKKLQPTSIVDIVSENQSVIASRRARLIYREFLVRVVWTQRQPSSDVILF